MSRSYRVAAMFLPAVILSACQTPMWVKDGSTQQSFNLDSYECERDARQSGYYGMGLVGAINMGQFRDRCMVARGWMLKAPEKGGS